MFGLALAMAAAPGGVADMADGSIAVFQRFVPFIFMFGILYFSMIRPKMKKALAHKALLESIKKGETVITAGGIHGKVSTVADGHVMLEVANDVNIKVTKGSIATVVKNC